jgi:hypothetical protein
MSLNGCVSLWHSCRARSSVSVRCACVTRFRNYQGFLTNLSSADVFEVEGASGCALADGLFIDAGTAFMHASKQAPLAPCPPAPLHRAKKETTPKSGPLTVAINPTASYAIQFLSALACSSALTPEQPFVRMGGRGHSAAGGTKTCKEGKGI